jgi:hypothetical protein
MLRDNTSRGSDNSQLLDKIFKEDHFRVEGAPDHFTLELGFAKMDHAVPF